MKETTFTSDASVHTTPALSALVVTTALLLTPGPLSDSLMAWVIEWLPWTTLGMSSNEYPVDKLVHVVLFAICGYLFCKEWLKTPRKLAYLYISLFIYGLAIELLQIPIPGRGGSIGDLIADSVGLLLGFYLAMRAKDASGKIF